EGVSNAGALRGVYSLGAVCRVEFVDSGPIQAGQSANLKFLVQDEAGQPIKLGRYLGMTGHLVVTRPDGAVFTHLHPGGSASMAAMQLSALRAEGKLPLRVALGKEDPVCKLPDPGAKELAWLNGPSGDEGVVTFPY